MIYYGIDRDSQALNMVQVLLRLIVAARTARTTRHAAGHTASLATSSVELHHDGVGNGLNLLLLGLILVGAGLFVLVKPRANVGSGGELLLVAGVKLLINARLLKGGAQVGSVVIKGISGADTATLGLISFLVLLGISQHALNLFLGQAALVVCDDNLVGLAGALLNSGDVHDTIGIKIKGDLNLGNTTGSGRNTSELKLAEQVVVLGALTFTFKDLDKHTRLVVGEGREDLGLLGGNGGVAGDKLGHHATSGLNTERQRSDIEQQNAAGGLGVVTRQDSSLDSSTVGDSLVGIDGLAGLLAIEVLSDELLDTGDTGRATDEDNLVNLVLVDLGIRDDAVEGLHGRTEEILAKLFETSSGDGSVEVDVLHQRVDLDRGLRSRRQSALGTLTGASKTAQST
ncbi:NAD-specific glutamate dehydrogenase [Metarhizium anisopliae]|nr:NAD-specific glutamate dehydrogenase [Metarhizium anisopliae]